MPLQVTALYAGLLGLIGIVLWALVRPRIVGAGGTFFVTIAATITVLLQYLNGLN